MGKILLSAFNGALTGYYNLPENWDGRDLWLMMDMENLNPKSFTEGRAIYDEPSPKRARFQQIPGGTVDKDNKPIYIYKLVEVTP